MTFIDPTKDEPNVRIYELGNNKLYVKRLDPYGFWHINFDKGQIPDHLKGAYTSSSEADKAVRKYLQDKQREVKAKN